MQDYKKLKVWEKSHQYTLAVYRLAINFPKEETFGLISQFKRAAVSIAANIAEGCGKNTNRDFANFLNIALGSANESEYYLLLARDLKYLSLDDYDVLYGQINEIKSMLIKLIQTIR